MNEQDEMLAARHAAREATFSEKSEIRNSENTPVPAEAPVGRKQYDGGGEVAITAWHFPNVGWQFQLTGIGRTMEVSGKGYVVLSLTGAAQLWRELSKALRDRGVIE